MVINAPEGQCCQIGETKKTKTVTKTNAKTLS